MVEPVNLLDIGDQFERRLCLARAHPVEQSIEEVVAIDQAPQFVGDELDLVEIQFAALARGRVDQLAREVEPIPDRALPIILAEQRLGRLVAIRAWRNQREQIHQAGNIALGGCRGQHQQPVCLFGEPLEDGVESAARGI